MRNVAILGIVCLGTLGMVSGCSDGTEGSGGAGGGGGSEASSSSSSSSSSTSSTSSGGGMGSSSSSSSASSSSSGGMAVNGCTSYQDNLAKPMVTISVGANGFKYDPACIRVKKDTKVNFVGAFTSHPTVGGLAGPPGVPDSASPIKQTNSGTSVTFTMDTVGTYPYYCEYHTPDMAGAIIVE